MDAMFIKKSLTLLGMIVVISTGGLIAIPMTAEGAINCRIDNDGNSVCTGGQRNEGDPGGSGGRIEIDTEGDQEFSGGGGSGGDRVGGGGQHQECLDCEEVGGEGEHLKGEGDGGVEDND